MAGIQIFFIAPENCLLMVRKVNTFAVLIQSLILIAVLFFPTGLLSQQRIPSRPYEWKTLRTDRFVMHYPEGYLNVARIAADIAEKTADRLQQVLRHNLSRRVPVFLYPSFQDFQATNILPYAIDEGTGGFTDFFQRRVVLPVNGDLEALRHVLAHEIVHAYQFDILGGNYGRYPLWLMEGMAEYLSAGTNGMDSIVRDLMIHSRMPDLFDLQFSGGGYMNYPGGQSIMHFIAIRWGPERIGMLLRELAALQDLDKAFRSTFGMNFFEFGLQYRLHLERTYAGAKAFAEPSSRYQKVSFRYLDRNGFHYKPALSPDGRTVAFLTYHSIFPAIVIRRLPGPGVSESEQSEKRLLLRFLRSADYEEWQPFTTRLYFHPDGSKLLFGTRNRARQSLAVVSIQDGSLIRLYTPPIDVIADPVYSADGRHIAFVGSIRGRSELFLMDAETGSSRPLTSDLCRESTPSFTPDNRFILYASCGNGDPIDPDLDLFRMDLQTGQIERLLSLRGRQEMPSAGIDGTVLFLSNHEGVRNLYRLQLDRKSATADIDRVVALTASNTDLLQFDVSLQHGESVVFSRREEGAVEIYRLASPSADKAFYRRYGGADPEEKRLPSVSTAGLVSTELTAPAFTVSPFAGPYSIIDYNRPYQPWLRLTGNPFIFVTGASDGAGNSAIAFLGYAAFQDLKGDHELEAFLSYQEKPVYLNGEVRYHYRRYRVHTGAGAYSYSGVFAIFNPLDFSLNNIIYNPFYRLSTLQTTGMMGWLEAPLHSYGALQFSVETGRDEFTYRPFYPEEQQREDVYKNRQSVRLRYLYDSTVYSIYGPLDGQAFMIMLEAPLRASGREREVYQHLLEYRLYHLFENDSIFALRALAVAATGADAKDYPYRIGGYYTVRGYDFQEFEGRYAGVINLEYRFTFIEQLIFGVPTRWSPGMIRSSFFMDAGAAFDDPATFQGWQHGRTRDLRASVGVGLHWANFLWFLTPGALMKIEWASPYDGRRTLPFSQWQGRFSIGVQF
jgi:Tol biopolymer transport system component